METQEIIDFCVELTNGYDESHDVNHHIAVYHNALEILNGLDTTLYQNYFDIHQMIMYASLLHDTIDSKYKNDLEIKIKKLDNFLIKKISTKSADVKWIIDNISYSKEVKLGYPKNMDPMVQLARDIVSDADKLEAIGEIGIRRCKQYTIASNPDISDEEQIMTLVIEHCREKLLKLKDSFIRTNGGMVLAKTRHEFIINFINQYESNK